jgi:HAD superfamily hydrolase (TIGR01509 family)
VVTEPGGDDVVPRDATEEVRSVRGYDLVIFDMDGLMFDTEQLSFASFRAAALEIADCSVDGELFARMIGANVEEVRRLCLGRFGPDFPFDAMLRRKHELSSAAIAGGVPLKEGLVELLQSLTDMGWKKAVATSSNRTVAADLLRRAGVMRHFDGVQCGDEVRRSKPDPEIFLRAAASLDCIPSTCLVLEDSPRGIRAAHRAGMDAIMVPDLLQPTQEDRSLVRAVLGSLIEVRDLLVAENSTL